MQELPRLERHSPPPRTAIVHLGPGAFFRAFNAVYTADAMAFAGGDWGIVGVSLKSPGARDQLGPQGGVYTAVELGLAGATARVIESVTDVLVLPEEPEKVLDVMSDPAVTIVSLTVTEKGYCHDPATGRLNIDHPDIAHDLTRRGPPRSAPGLLVAALARRHAAGLRPFTVLSCDNLPANGRLVRGVVLDLAGALDPDLAAWIAREGRFPATMVDRITPATTADDIARLADAEGYQDPACVQHEPFRQWVIEDDFAGDRPAWELAGAQFVGDVSAHEVMKLRCLNGTHSALAYLGYLAGFDSIAETVADAGFAGLCMRLWRDEILPTVPPPQGEDPVAYCDGLLGRYRNPGIRHRTWQIAADGSQKLPQRILGTVADSLRTGRVPHGLCLAVAGWMRYVGGVDETGRPIDVRDPLAGRLQDALRTADSAEGQVAALLAVSEVFDPSLVADTRFSRAVTRAYEGLGTVGAKRMVSDYAA